MRAATKSITLAGLLLTGVFSPSFAQPAPPAPGQPAPAQIAPAQPALGQPASRRGGPCDQIAAACKQAGFIPKGAKTGLGIFVDCIRPIMAGPTPALQPTPATPP